MGDNAQQNIGISLINYDKEVMNLVEKVLSIRNSSLSFLKTSKHEVSSGDFLCVCHSR